MMANFVSIANMNHQRKLMMFIQGTSTYINSEFILNYPHKKSKVCILSIFLILCRRNSLFFLIWKVYKSHLSRFVYSYEKVPAKVCQIILKVNNLEVLLTLVPGICADPTLSEA